jgi:hypothetical protein
MPCGVHRVFLDTNVVQALRWLADYIWEGDESALLSTKFLRAGRKAQDDYHALRWMFGSPRGQPFEVVLSRRTLAEFQATRDEEKRHALLRHGMDLYGWAREVETHQDPTDGEVNLALGLWQSLLLTLPDEMDRELVAEAAMRDCDTFLTLDRRTIGKHRELIECLVKWTGLSILRPSEAWGRMKPWAGLIW